MIKKDGIAKQGLVGEYKFNCHDIVKDVIDEGPKFASELDILICWSIITDPTNKKWKMSCQSVETIENPSQHLYFGVTHILKLAISDKPIKVMSLEKLIQHLNQGATFQDAAVPTDDVHNNTLPVDEPDADWDLDFET